MLTDFRFRSSPHIDIKQLAELPAEQRAPFLELESDPDFHGLFIPRPPLTTNLQAVSRQMAELFRALAKPSRIDAALVADEHSAAGIVDLVLDGILEIENGEGFVYGADALPLLAPPLPPAEARGAIARLSRDALLYAQDLETTDPGELTAALYAYNRVPISPSWRTRFATPEAILAHLGTDGGSLRALLEREWIPQPPARTWLSWRPRSRVQPNADDVTYKLYISPRPERIRDAFEIVIRVLADFPGTPFKIGNTAAGLLRPDKFVAYFTTRELLDDAADALRRELAGCDAHGVPFSAGMDDSGMLSWGLDPPAGETALRWLGRDSWRFWITKRLGAALSIAKTSSGSGSVDSWHFAVQRARRHGVDVESWTPSPSLWRSA